MAITIDINTRRVKITGIGQTLDGGDGELIHVFPRRVRVKEAAVKLAQIIGDNALCAADPYRFAIQAGVPHMYAHEFDREYRALMRLRRGQRG